MKKPSPAPGPGIDNAERLIDRPPDELLAEAYPWLDALEPFCIDWELIWPM